MSATLQELRPHHGAGVKKNRWPGIIFVIVFHAALIYALVTGLANSTVQLLKGNLEAVVTQEEVKTDQPPPPPPPDFKPPPVVAVTPDVQIDLAAAPAPQRAVTVAPPAPPAPPRPVAVAPPPPPPPPTPPVLVDRPPITASDYPAISQRLQEQGTVLIKYLVGKDGSIGECTVQTSSGKPRLDDAACEYVKRKWKYKPGTQSGKPIASYATASVQFRLR
jgi:periplasmic protein TonB